MSHVPRLLKNPDFFGVGSGARAGGEGAESGVDRGGGGWVAAGLSDFSPSSPAESSSRSGLSMVHPNKWQIAKFACVIQAIANDECIGTREARKVDRHTALMT